MQRKKPLPERIEIVGYKQDMQDRQSIRSLEDSSALIMKAMRERQNNTQNNTRSRPNENATVSSPLIPKQTAPNQPEKKKSWLSKSYDFVGGDSPISPKRNASSEKKSTTATQTNYTPLRKTNGSCSMM